MPIGFIQIIEPAREDSHYWGDCPDGRRAIDIWIGEEANLRRGFGTQMMTLAIEWCFADPLVRAILIDPLESNSRARRFYERLGFRFVENRRFGDDDCAVYQLDRLSWVARDDSRESELRKMRVHEVPGALASGAAANGLLRRPQRAVHATRGAEPARWHAADRERFLADTRERLLDHGVGEFIVSVHWLKTALAVRDEVRSGVPEHTADLLLTGLSRFLNARLKRRHLRRSVYQARRFVARE